MPAYYLTNVPFLFLRYLFFYDVKQLNLELQYAVRFDILSCATFAISQLSRDPEDIFRTDRHDLQALSPALDYLANTELSRLATLVGAVEHSAVDQGAVVVRTHVVFAGRLGAFASGQHFELQAGSQGGDAFTLGVFRQECQARTGSRFGAGHIVDVLTGKATDKVKEWQHDQVSTFGIGTELDDKGWRTLIRQLVAHGALAVDHERYGALTLTESARPLLRGEAAFTMRLDVVAPKKGRNVGSARKATDWPEATGAEAELLGRLRAWRASTAKERNVPAYVIFHDATLRDIARTKPDSIEALGTISGVGDRKLEAYGEEIIGLIPEHA